MYRLNKICVSLFLLFVASVVSVSAQVATTLNGYPVIDLTELSPLGCVLSSSEASARRTTMNAQTPSNSTYLGVGSSVSGTDGSWNLQMSIKYQVMRADHSVEGTDWANAYNQCKSYSGEGGSAGQWRLPTQRELIIIWGLHPQLIGLGSFTSFVAGSYWSSAENDASGAWYITFYYGLENYGNKTFLNRLRCVRDL